MHQADIGDINVTSYEPHTCHPPRLKPRCRQPRILHLYLRQSFIYFRYHAVLRLGSIFHGAGRYLIIYRILDAPTGNISAILYVTVNYLSLISEQRSYREA